MNPQNYSLIFRVNSQHKNPLLESSWKNHKRFVPELNQTDTCTVLIFSCQSSLSVFPTPRHAIKSVTKLVQKCLYFSSQCKKKNRRSIKVQKHLQDLQVQPNIARFTTEPSSLGRHKLNFRKVGHMWVVRASFTHPACPAQHSLLAIRAGRVQGRILSTNKGCKGQDLQLLCFPWTEHVLCLALSQTRDCAKRYHTAEYQKHAHDLNPLVL